MTVYFFWSSVANTDPYVVNWYKLSDWTKKNACILPYVLPNHINVRTVERKHSKNWWIRIVFWCVGEAFVIALIFSYHKWPSLWYMFPLYHIYYNIIPAKLKSFVQSLEITTHNTLSHHTILMNRNRLGSTQTKKKKSFNYFWSIWKLFRCYFYIEHEIFIEIVKL